MRRRAAAALCTLAAAAAPSAGAAAHTRLFAIGNDATRLRQHARAIDVAAPNWYTVDPSGRVRGAPNPAYLRAAGRAQVWPVVNARLGFRPGWLRARPHAVARRIAAVARRYDGITLDIEEIPPGMRAAYSAWVTDVARRTPHLAVYTVRRTAAPPLRSAAAYDQRALARSADLVLTSAFGEHSPRSAPGPLTTPAGFARTLDYARATAGTRAAPVLGAFGIAWPLFAGPPAHVISTAGLPRRTGHAIVDGTLVYYGSAAALRAQRRAAARAGLRWVALFSLGREPRGFW